MKETDLGSGLTSMAEESAGVEFPLRLAAIDVGSNAIRFLAAEFSSPASRVTLDYVRAPVRLGHEAFLTGRIPSPVLDEAAETLADFRRRMDSLSIRRVRAVATSAVRESRNGPAFVARVREESGIVLEPITGIEEARLVWLAARERVAMGDGDWVLMDLGGGSVELSLANADEVHWSESFMLGTVRLLEELGPIEDRLPAQYRRLVADQTAVLERGRVARTGVGRGLIATGGNIEALADIAGGAPDEAGVRRVGVEWLSEIFARMASLSTTERIVSYGLREDRADVIVPAALVYERVARLVGAQEIIVPGVGVKDGVLLDLMDEAVEIARHESRLEGEVIAGALALGARYEFDAPHAQQVAKLSLQLFDHLRPLHGMGAQERRILAAAALLHDIGQFIAYRKHHKHSYYLISEAELPGFSTPQIRLVALVARYHRRALPKTRHEGYSELDRGDRKRVGKLAALLRVADALDREHRQQVELVEVVIEKERVTLEVAGTGDLYPELWAVPKKADLFEGVYERRLRVRVKSEE